MDKVQKNIDMDEIYTKIPLEKIPWNIEEPPEILVELIKNENIKQYKIVDIGCGAGNYAIYFAKLGFDVSGIDISQKAIEIARENVKNKGVKSNFFVADVIENLSEIKETFDLAYDWEFLHHIYPDFRQKYVKNLYSLLNPEGKYISVCFSEKDPQFGGSGKYRKTPLGTILYFSSEDELKELFSPYFNIMELKTIEVAGKSSPHLANFVFMEKK